MVNKLHEADNLERRHHVGCFNAQTPKKAPASRHCEGHQWLAFSGWISYSTSVYCSSTVRLLGLPT